MQTNGIFTVDLQGVKSALVATVLAALIAGAVYVVGVGDVFAINLHSLVNVVAIAFLVGLVSLGQHFLTDNNGKFLGMTQTQ